MTQDYNKQIKILLSFIEVCDNLFQIEFNENQIEELFERKITSQDIDNTLQLFGELELMKYSRGGEDGFAEHFSITINRSKSLKYIQEIYYKQFSEFQNIINSQSEKITNIYGFSPEKIVTEIKDSKAKLFEIENSMKDSELLKGLKPKIDEISDYLNKTEKVISNYENIYLNIIKPIKQEGKQGIFWTAFWAIISIIATAILSIYLSLPSTIPQDKLTDFSKTENVVGTFSLENKVDFLTRELLRLNESFEPNQNTISINQYSNSLFLLSKNDTIHIEPYSFNDIEYKNTYYASVDLRFYLNQRLISTELLRKLFVVKSKITHNRNSENCINVIEGDRLQFEDKNFIIDKIFTKETKSRQIGDKSNEIRIIKINK